MDQSQLIYSLYLLLGVFISAISQVMLKKASMKTYPSLLYEYMNPLVILAYTLFVATTFLSILAYKKIPISMGPVLEATSYLYVTIFGAKFFHEKITRRKIIALALIVSGIAIYALFG